MIFNETINIHPNKILQIQFLNFWNIYKTILMYKIGIITVKAIHLSIQQLT